MDILIINHNGGSIYHGPNLRTYYAAKELAKLGHTVTIASSAYSHKYIELPKTTGVVTSEHIDGINYKWVRCVKYRNLLQRIYSHFEFGLKIICFRRRICPEPDLVVFSGPPPEVFLFSWLYARLQGAPIISDIRDLWPRTQLEMNGWQWLNPFTYFLFFCQFVLVRFSDRLVTPLPGAGNYLNPIGPKLSPQIIENGVDLSPKPSSIEPKLEIAGCGNGSFFEVGSEVCLSEIKSLGKFIVGYAGAFDRDNDIDSLISAARKMVHRKEVLFLMIGGGIRRNDVIAAANSLPNLIVCERVPSTAVLDVLEIMDVCYCGLKPKKIYTYGVSLAKSFEYMAAQKPILWMIEAFNNPVKDSGGGFVIEPSNVPMLVNAIEDCFNSEKEELERLGMLGFFYLKENYSYEVLGEKWAELVSEFDNATN